MPESGSLWRNNWHVLEEIDRGGQGIVTQVKEVTDPQRLAVLKQIVPRWRDDPQARERLRQEAETLTLLHSKGAMVPEVYESSISNDSSEPYLIMEFIEGVRFDKWLKNEAPTDPRNAATITRNIARTIELCHKCKIGHRDIKPTNIILKNGEISSPYILDFGISFDSRQSVVLTRDGEMFWNEFIMLPECQDRTGGHRDLRSDITALAGIFFACITGEPPVMLRDSSEMAPHQRHESLLTRNVDSAEVTEQLMWFFDRAFSYRIDRRYQTLDGFIEELDRFSQPPIDEDLDIFEQFKILDSAVVSTDRNVQLIALRAKYFTVRSAILKGLEPTKKRLATANAKSNSINLDLRSLAPENQLNIKGTELLDRPQEVHAILISRDHFNFSAVCLIAGVADGMDIHVYTTSYFTSSNNWKTPSKRLVWEKTIVVPEDMKEVSTAKIKIAVQALSKKLAREIKELARRVNNPS